MGTVTNVVTVTTTYLRAHRMDSDEKRHRSVQFWGAVAAIIAIPLMVVGLLLDHPPKFEWDGPPPLSIPGQGKGSKEPVDPKVSQPDQKSDSGQTKKPNQWTGEPSPAPPPNENAKPDKREEQAPALPAPVRPKYDPANPSAYYVGWNRADALQEFSRTTVAVTCPKCSGVFPVLVPVIENHKTIKLPCKNEIRPDNIRSWIADQRQKIIASTLP